MAGAETRIIKVAIPPTSFSNGGERVQNHIGKISLANLGLDLQISGWGVWGCDLVEDSALRTTSLVYAEPSMREVIFLFGMFDATDSHFTVKFEMERSLLDDYYRIYQDDRKRERLKELTSGNDIIKRGLIGINALLYLVEEMRSARMLAIKPLKLLV